MLKLVLILNEHLVFYIYLFFISASLAFLEIQVEGANGWAKGLPTWRIENKWTRKLIGTKPLTGYHVHLILFIFLFAHLPYFLGFIILSLAMEMRLLSFIILLLLTEDFLWFVFNPAYGIKKFKPQYIWWHSSSWWWIMPRDYWIFGPIGIALYLLSMGR